MSDIVERLRYNAGPEGNWGVVADDLQIEAADEIERLRKLLSGRARFMEVERLRAELAAKQARIDALMLEHCPGEMTHEQLEEWGKHQRPALEDKP